MDRALRLAIAKVRVRGLFPGKAWIFVGCFLTAKVAHSTVRIMFTFISLFLSFFRDFDSRNAVQVRNNSEMQTGTLQGLLPFLESMV